LQAIVICTVSNPGIDVLLASLKAYAPDIPVYLAGAKRNGTIWLPNIEKNFGDAYNVAVDCAFRDGYDSVIMANDDIVLTPSTIKLMQEDWQDIQEYNVGIMGARSDYVLPDQNIRFPIQDDQMIGVKYRSESYIKETPVIAPIFAAISKKAWDTAKFPSINWYSDNIMCSDLAKAGFRHFVSRGYVHHAGSQTVGTDFNKCHEESKAWIKANRPDVFEEYYG
jgi:hypothetical protein